jgi:hypothetical protein
MDPTQTTGSDQLKISVAAPPLWTYIAGDSIIGSVNRCPHVVVPDAIISIALIGHARTSIERDARNSAKKYHGVWELFEFAPQILYRGPVPKAGSSDTDMITIPFEINIPKTTSLPALDDHAQAESFIPLHAGYIAQHPLSGSFSSEWPGAKSCIDYHLQAQMQYMQDGSPQIYRATAPIILGHPTVDPSTICFALQRRSISSRVSGNRMLPSSQNENLSLMQKTQKMFSLSKKPGFYFTVDMLMPLHIQLDNPTPFPLILRVVPQEKGSEDVRKDIVQLIKINWMRLSISSQVEIVCKPDGSSSCHKLPKDENVFTQSLGLEQVFPELKEPIVTFSGPRDQQINIGNILQLVLRHDGLRSGGKRLSQSLSIQPSFVTFNIRLSHSLIWDMSLDIAGETKTFSTGAGLTIHNSATRS